MVCIKYLPLVGHIDVVINSDNLPLKHLPLGTLDQYRSEIGVLPAHYSIPFQKNAMEQINNTLFFCNSLVALTESG